MDSPGADLELALVNAPKPRIACLKCLSALMEYRTNEPGGVPKCKLTDVMAPASKQDYCAKNTYAVDAIKAALQPHLPGLRSNGEFGSVPLSFLAFRYLA